MVDRNSHVGRIVHPPDWPHAAAVRRYAPTFVNTNAATFRLFTDLTLLGHTYSCRRCERLRVVWAPAEYALRPSDAGPCPNCDKWHAPHVVQHEDGRAWDSAALRIGETVAWHELSDRSVLEIAAFESWREQYFRTASAQFLRSMMITSCRRDSGFALAEAAYRNTLPTPEDLRIACDLAEARGVLTPDAIERWTLVEVWARCMPLLWELRS